MYYFAQIPEQLYINFAPELRSTKYEDKKFIRRIKSIRILTS
jgi:hypothetical protein